MDTTHPASVEDVHEIALGMPFVTVYVQQSGHPGRKGGSDVTGRQVQGSQPV